MIGVAALLRHRFAAALVSVCVTGSAQTYPKEQESTVWDGDKVVVWETNTASEFGAHNLRVEKRHSKATRVIDSPPGAIGISYWDGVAWAVIRRAGSTEKHRPSSRPIGSVMRCGDQKNWVFYAEIVGETLPINLVPLDDGQFLGVSPVRGFIVEGDASHWAVFAMNDKSQLTLKRLLKFDLKEPVYLANSATPGGPKRVELNSKYMSLAGLPYQIPAIRTPDGIAIVAQKAGVVWIVHPETGEIRSRTHLFSGVTEEKLSGADPLEVCILGIQPRMNGHLLIATRTEDAVLRSAVAFNLRLTVDTVKSKDKLSDYHERANRALQGFPEILWWDLDPKTGSLRREDPPMNVPSKIWDLRILAAFRFRFKPDGDLMVSY